MGNKLGYDFRGSLKRMLADLKDAIEAAGRLSAESRTHEEEMEKLRLQIHELRAANRAVHAELAEVLAAEK